MLSNGGANSNPNQSDIKPKISAFFAGTHDQHHRSNPAICRVTEIILSAKPSLQPDLKPANIHRVSHGVCPRLQDPPSQGSRLWDHLDAYSTSASHLASSGPPYLLGLRSVNGYIHPDPSAYGPARECQDSSTSAISRTMKINHKPPPHPLPQTLQTEDSTSNCSHLLHPSRGLPTSTPLATTSGIVKPHRLPAKLTAPHPTIERAQKRPNQRDHPNDLQTELGNPAQYVQFHPPSPPVAQAAYLHCPCTAGSRIVPRTPAICPVASVNRKASPVAQSQATTQSQANASTPESYHQLLGSPSSTFEVLTMRNPAGRGRSSPPRMTYPLPPRAAGAARPAPLRAHPYPTPCAPPPLGFGAQGPPFPFHLHQLPRSALSQDHAESTCQRGIPSTGPAQNLSAYGLAIIVPSSAYGLAIIVASSAYGLAISVPSSAYGLAIISPPRPHPGPTTQCQSADNPPFCYQDDGEPSGPWSVLPTPHDFPAATARRRGCQAGGSAGTPVPHAGYATIPIPEGYPIPTALSDAAWAQRHPCKRPRVDTRSGTAIKFDRIRRKIDSDAPVYIKEVNPLPCPDPKAPPGTPQPPPLPIEIGKKKERIWKGKRLFRFPVAGPKQRQVCVNRKGAPQFVLERHDIDKPTPTSDHLKKIVSTVFKMASMRQKNETNGNKLAGQMRLVGFRPGTDKGKKGGTYACCPNMTAEDIKTMSDAEVLKRTHCKASKAEAAARAAQKKNPKKRKR
ncbi:hypothetical protein PtB15_8B2 [Puccinia triticina]|nr:hypothetical protein PtB15_8B2 [Puccinia triticina]